MSDSNLNLIISCAVMLIAVVSVWKDVYNNNPRRKFLSRFTRIGKILLLASFIFIFVNYIRDQKAEQKVELAVRAKKSADSLTKAAQERFNASQKNLINAQNSLYNLQLSIKDTILKNVDSSYLKSIKSSNEALAKYHIRLIDSLHTVVGTLKLNAANPQLSIAAVSGHPTVFLERPGSDTLKIQFISANSTAYNIAIDAYFIFDDGKNAQVFEKDILSVGQTFINPEVTRTESLQIQRGLLNYDNILVVLYGSFSKDPFDKYRIPYLQSFIFNFKENKYIGGHEISLAGFKKLVGLN